MIPVFADPKTCFVFKRIFGVVERKPLFIALLNHLLELEGEHRILDVEHLSLEQHVAVPELKLSIVDVKCTEASGRRFVVDARSVADPRRHRALYGRSRRVVAAQSPQATRPLGAARRGRIGWRRSGARPRRGPMVTPPQLRRCLLFLLAAGCSTPRPEAVAGEPLPPSPMPSATATAAPRVVAESLCAALCAAAPSYWRSAKSATLAPPGVTGSSAPRITTMIVLSPIAVPSYDLINRVATLSAAASRSAVGGLALVVDDDNAKATRSLLERLPAPRERFQVLRLPSKEIAARFGIERYPETWVLDDQGRARAKFFGDYPVDEEAFRALLAKVAAGSDCDVAIDPREVQGIAKRPSITGPDAPACATAYPP